MPVDFEMTGARAAILDGLDHIQQHVEQIEKDVEGNPASAVDLARAIVEGTCKRVLEERSQQFSADAKLHALFKQALACTPILPPSGPGAAELRKTLTLATTGLVSTVQGLSELRNGHGFASHLAGTPQIALGRAHGVLAASAADTAVAFLYTCHRSDVVRTENRVPEYGEEPEFDEAIDDAFGTLEIYELSFRASFILHGLDPEGYRSYLTEFKASDLNHEASSREGDEEAGLESMS